MTRPRPCQNQSGECNDAHSLSAVLKGPERNHPAASVAITKCGLWRPPSCCSQVVPRHPWGPFALSRGFVYSAALHA